MPRLLLAVLAAALAAPHAPAAPVPGEAGKGVPLPFPAKAPVVVCLNGYDKARARFGKMLANAVPKEAPVVTRLLDDLLEKAFEGRKLTAVRKDARAFLVLNDLAGLIDDTPALSALIPVTTYKEFLDTALTKDELKSLDRGRDGVDAFKTFAAGDEKVVYLVDLKEYVALSLDKDTAAGYAGKYAAGSADAIGSELAETFLKADVAVYVNMDAINEKFGDQIRAVKSLIDFGLQQAQQQGALQAFNKKQIDAIKVVLKGLVQGVEDCRAVVLAAEFRPDGLLVRLQARFAENSASAKLIASELPSPLTDLGKLPGGLGTYQAHRFGKSVGDVLRELSTEFATTDEDARGAELIEQHLKDLAAAGPGAELTGSSAPGAAVSVVPYKDAGKAAKAISKAYKAVAAGGRVNGTVVKTAPRVSDAAESYRDFTFSAITLTHDYEASVAGLPEAAREATLETLKRTVPEKMNQWVGTDGKVVVRITADKWADAKVLLDRYLDGKNTLGADPGFKRVREQLPAEANVIIVAEVESAISNAVASMKAASEAIPGFPRLGPLKKPGGGDPAYVGLAVTLKGEIATVTGYVPTAAITAARNMLESLFKKIE